MNAKRTKSTVPPPRQNKQDVRDALRFSEAQMRAILNTTVDGIITIDEHGIIGSFNPAAERIFGYARDEVIGRNISVLMAAENGAAHDGYIQRYLRSGQANIIGRGRQVLGMRKDGTSFPLYLAVSQVEVEEGRFFTGILRDITEQKAVENALHEERNFVTTILETIGALIAVFDNEGRILRFNRSCEDVTGFRFDEVQGKSFFNLFLKEEEVDDVREVFDRVVSGDFPTTHECCWVHRDGTCRRIVWSNTALPAPAGEVGFVVSTGIDITERRMAEEAIVSVSEGERQVIGQELHDALGQQLTGISLLTKALERRLLAGDHPGKEDAAKISQLAREAIDETKRLAHGLYPTELEKHGLQTALEELAERQSSVYRIRCTYEGDVNLPAFDKSTSLHLYRIAQEALNNAIRHGKAANPALRMTMEEGHPALTIEDDGVGLPAEPPTHRGLGLAIMNYRAHMVGGTFAIGPSVHGGVIVTCTLPRLGAGSREESAS